MFPLFSHSAVFIITHTSSSERRTSRGDSAVRRHCKFTMANLTILNFGTLALCLWVTQFYCLNRLVSSGEISGETSFSSSANILSSSPRRWRPDDESNNTNNVRVLIFITTIFSQRHQDYFNCCWPRLLKHSQNLQSSDVMIFSNNETTLSESILSSTRQVFTESNIHLNFQFATPDELLEVQQELRKENRFQRGANLGVKLAIAKRWFEAYDWVIRINPDVLIRDSTWIWQTMQDPEVDGIFVKCHPTIPRIHTDFFAVRTNAIPETAFREMEYDYHSSVMLNHEVTAYKAFETIIQKNRHRYLSNVEPSRGFCRAVGNNAPVFHSHTSCRNESMICDALEGFSIQ